MAKRSDVLFVIRYRRDAWDYAQTRTYLTEAAARRLIERLHGDDWIELSPLTFVEMTRRPLGDEEVIHSWRQSLPAKTPR